MNLPELSQCSQLGNEDKKEFYSKSDSYFNLFAIGTKNTILDKDKHLFGGSSVFVYALRRVNFCVVFVERGGDKKDKGLTVNKKKAG